MYKFIFGSLLLFTFYEISTSTPVWTSYSSLNTALMGHDIFMAKPYSSISTWADRYRIFYHYQNETSNALHPGISLTTLESCSPQMEESVITSIEEYRAQQREAYMYIMGEKYWELDPDIKQMLPPEIANETYDDSNLGPFELYHYSEKSLVGLFKSNGALVQLKLVCPLYNSTLDSSNMPLFQEGFKIGVQRMYQSSKHPNPKTRIRQFQNFIDNYGTHYSSETLFGKALLYTRKFSERDRGDLTDQELIKCARKQTGISIFALEDQDDSGLVCPTGYPNEGYSTFGSFFVFNITEWLSGDNDTPSDLKNRFRPIVDLFTHDNVREIDPQINATELVQWFYPLYLNVSTIMRYKKDEYY